MRVKMNADLVMCFKPCIAWTWFVSFYYFFLILFYVMIKRAFALRLRCVCANEQTEAQQRKQKKKKKERNTVYECISHCLNADIHTLINLT